MTDPTDNTTASTAHSPSTLSGYEIHSEKKVCAFIQTFAARIQLPLPQPFSSAVAISDTRKSRPS